MTGRALALLALASLTCAAAPCGTAVIPTGIGLGNPSAPTGLNPLLWADGQTLHTILPLYRPLVWIGPNLAFDTERSLAASVQAFDGNTRFRVTLKPWRWSDGKPITSDDVVFGWNLIKALGASFPQRGVGGIPDRAEVHPVSDLAVDFVLKAATNPEWFTLNGLSIVYPLPRHAWGNITPDQMQARAFDANLYQVVDGPFRLTEVQPDRYIAYEPNPRYGGHLAQLRRLVVIFPELTVGLHKLWSGEADMARVSAAVWRHLQGTPGFSFKMLPEPYGYAALMLNMHSLNAPFLADVRVRRALALAVDQQSIIDIVFGGMGTENHMPAPTGAGPWRGPEPDDGTAIHYDPAKAKAALAASGWQPGPDGVRRLNGRRLAFTAITGEQDSEVTRLLQMMQEELRAVGIDMSLRIMPYPQMMLMLQANDGSWDAAFQAFTPSSVPDGVSYFDTGGSSNPGGYSNKEMDRLIADTVGQAGTASLFAYQKYAEAEQPMLFLPQGRQLIMVANRVHGVEDFVNEYGFWSPEYLSVDDPACHGTGPGAAGH